MSDVTQILSQIEKGDRQAVEQLLALVYDRLRTLAAQKMAREKPGQTLQATALVHEAFLRLINVEQPQHWDSRRHFFAAAAEAMRRLLVENARRKRRIKRGAGLRRTSIEKVEVVCPASQMDVVALSDALDKLAGEAPEKAEVVRLRYFAGLSHQEIAEILGVSVVTVKRYWRYARVWLHRQLESDGG